MLYRTYPPKEGYRRSGGKQAPELPCLLSTQPIPATADIPIPDDTTAVRPLRPDELEPALRVIEAAQALATAGGDTAETLAGLARQLTEFVDASACLISLVDLDRGTVHDRAGYARPPHRIDRIAGDYALADYPRTAEVIATGNAMTCTADDAEAGEMRLLVEPGLPRRC